MMPHPNFNDGRQLEGSQPSETLRRKDGCQIEILEVRNEKVLVIKVKVSYRSYHSLSPSDKPKVIHDNDKEPPIRRMSRGTPGGVDLRVDRVLYSQAQEAICEH